MTLKLFNPLNLRLYLDLDTPEGDIMLCRKKLCHVREIGQVFKDEHNNLFVHHFTTEQASKCLNSYLNQNLCLT